MSSSIPFQPSQRGETRPYRVSLLRDPAPTRRGIAHRCDDGEELLEWDRVLCAVAAEIGEPEGVRTIVFDLLVERCEAYLAVCRIDADPATLAIPLAAAIERALGPERTTVSLRTLASDGSPAFWFPDVESFEAATATTLFKT